MKIKYLFVAALVALFSGDVFGNDQSVPKLEFQYSWSIDLYCRPEFRPTLEQHAILIENVAKFQKIWDAIGPKLFKKAIELTGRSFPYQVQPVALYGCKDPTQAPTPVPAQFPIWQFIKELNPYSDKYASIDFVTLVFHEFMHLLVSNTKTAPEGWLPQSPNVQRHMKAGEDITMYTHLHVIALEQSVFTALKLPNYYKRAIDYYSLYLPTYARTWRVVEREGADIYIKELQLR